MIKHMLRRRADTVRILVPLAIIRDALVCLREWSVIPSGMLIRRAKSVNQWVRVEGSMGWPSHVVNNLSWSCHLSPSLRRWRSCQDRYCESMSNVSCGSLMVRLDSRVFGVSVYTPRFGIYTELRRTVTVQLSQCISSHSKPQSSPRRRPVCSSS